MTKSNDELPSLEALQKKIDRIKPEEDDEQQSEAQKSAIAKAARMGTELLAGSGIGCVLGYYLDKALGTLPVFFILFFFLGFAAGLRNIIRNADKL